MSRRHRRALRSLASRAHSALPLRCWRATPPSRRCVRRWLSPSAVHPVPEVERAFGEVLFARCLAAIRCAELPRTGPRARRRDPARPTRGRRLQWRRPTATGDGIEPTVPNTFELTEAQFFEETVVEPALQSPHPYHELTGTTYQTVDLDPPEVPAPWVGAVEQSAVPVSEPESPDPAAHHIDEPVVFGGETSEAHGEREYRIFAGEGFKGGGRAPA